MAEKSVEEVGVMIGDVLTTALSKLRWSVESGEWSAYVKPEEAAALLKHIESLNAFAPQPFALEHGESVTVRLPDGTTREYEVFNISVNPDGLETFSLREVPEPDAEPEEELFTLTLTDGAGKVIKVVQVTEEDFDTLVGDARTYTTGTGQVLHNVHDPADCAGRHCTIHNPSDHYMADFPTHWRDDRGIMERICPHGVGHPDPDDMAFIRLTRGEDAARVESVHGCDGCCTPKAQRHPSLQGNS